MKLYNVIFSATVDLSLVPLEGRKIVDALTFWEPATDYPEWQDVLVYEHLPVVCMWLSPEEKEVLEAVGLEVEPYQRGGLEPLADYAPDGTIDPVFLQGQTVRNDGLVKVEGVGTKDELAFKVHHFTGPDTSQPAGILENYYHAAYPSLSCFCFRADGLVYPAFLQELGFVKAWKAGYTGAEIKIGLIDAYYENGWNPDFTIQSWKHFGPGEGVDRSDASGYADSEHVQTQLGILVAQRFNEDGTARANGLVGALYDAEVYLASPANIIADIEYFIGLGVDVISISYSGIYGGATAAAIKKATDKGIGVFVAAGNAHVYSEMNALAANPGAVPVGGLKAGAYLKTTTELAALSIQPYLNKGVTFAANYYATQCGVVPARPIWAQPYGWTSGTSFACPLVAAIYCVYKQRFPQLSHRARIELMKLHSTSSAVPEIRIPSLNHINF